MAKAALPKAAAETLGDFLRDKELTVPSFQRDYAWLRGNCEQLVWDLHQFLLSKREHYVVGQVIIAPDPSSRTSRSVVDGQQRLTTFYLMFLAVRNIARDMEGDEGQRNGLIETINRLLYDPSLNSGKKTPRVRNTRAGRRMLEALLENKFEEEPQDSSEENIKKNYEFIYRVIKNSDDFRPYNKSVSKLSEFLEGILSRVCVVVLALDDRDEAIEYFEKLNSRGKRLDDDDLLKALVLKDLPEDLHEKSVATWQSARNVLYSAARSKEMKGALSKMTFLLGAMIRQRLGERVGNRKLFEEWSSIISHKSGQPKRLRSGVERVSVTTFLSEIEKNSRALSHIGSGKLPDGSSTSALEGIRHFDAVQLYNVLLAGHLLPRPEFEHLCDLAEARWVLSSISDEQSRVFERSIPGWTRAIFDLSRKRKVDLDRVSDVSREFFSTADELLEGSVDEIRRFHYERRGQDKKIRFVLAMVTRQSEIRSKREKASVGIDEFLRTEVPHSGRMAYALDHIYPKSKAGVGDELKHSIGNLALLKSMANSKEGSRLPRDKSVSYNESWVINRALCDLPSNADSDLLAELERVQSRLGSTLTNWDDTAIENRRDFIAEEFKLLMASRLRSLKVYE